MTQRHVESVIGRLATDPGLRARFLEQPSELLAELRRAGAELSAVERAALASIDGDALAAFAASLDRRIRRAPSSGGDPPAPG